MGNDEAAEDGLGLSGRYGFDGRERLLIVGAV